MLLNLSKKGTVALAVVIIVIVALIFFGWLINLNNRECSSDNDCGDDSYCGSDFACHEHIIVEKTIEKNDLIIPSIFVGIAIIVGAIILKWKRE
ncbi:hypothetical protein K9M79_07100 [Candidatus Woesearchaeota archaeon]|nr:hypothetical protein [Candidatus Woesearchaeota archaeon]